MRVTFRGTEADADRVAGWDSSVIREWPTKPRLERVTLKQLFLGPEAGRWLGCARACPACGSVVTERHVHWIRFHGED